MSVVLTFKSGCERTLLDATNATRKGGVVILTRADGSEVSTFDAGQIIAVNGKPLADKAN